ncbi:MAG: energy transducer TonB [Alphaproteobacteria bacterium]|nr:energy transducer TonB [Alphaproteobacteria bacterium]
MTDNGFAITPGPMSSALPPDPPAPPRPDLFALRATGAPKPSAAPTTTATRLAPLVIATGARHDPRLPAYPSDARFKGEQGNVLIEVELDPSGAIRQARLKQSSGHDSLDAAALRSARLLRFKPPKAPPGVVLRNTIVVEIPFNFRLD